MADENKKTGAGDNAEGTPAGAALSADAVLKTSQRDLNIDAKRANKEALYKNANRQNDRNKREAVAAGEVQSKLIRVNRITKVVKGGRTLRFNAVVIVGNLEGMVAVGVGKAREVSEAIKKAEQDGKKQFKLVPVVGTTVPHEVIGVFGTSKVKIMPAREGNGIIAGGPVRAVLELAGYRDVTAKCYGSTNSINVVKAVIDGLLKLRTKEQIAKIREEGTEVSKPTKKAK